MIGPVVKISDEDLPRRENIHYLGGKDYDELPDYIAGWDVAMMPFAINESTKFISPTKTPEYLAAGRPVVSTAIPTSFGLTAKRGSYHRGNAGSVFRGDRRGDKGRRGGPQSSGADEFLDDDVMGQDLSINGEVDR